MASIFWKTIGNIVDKANLSAIDRDASDNPGRFLPFFNGGESSGVDYFEIFHLHLVDGIDFLHDHCMGLPDGMLLAESHAFGKRGMDRGSESPLSRRQERISA